MEPEEVEKQNKKLPSKMFEFPYKWGQHTIFSIKFFILSESLHDISFKISTFLAIAKGRLGTKWKKKLYKKTEKGDWQNQYSLNINVIVVIYL